MGVSLCDSVVLFFLGGVLLFDFGGRDARPCIPRVRDVRCPASAMKCFSPGPLGDASGNFFLVLASVNVFCMTAVGVICAPLYWCFEK